MSIPRIEASSLADISEADHDFYDTSFFQSDSIHRPQLPAPIPIIEAWRQHGTHVVKFEELNLAVKIGHRDHVRLEEAQTMRAISKTLPHDILPVPEVFGWRTHADINLIYMSLIRGKTLRQAWPDLTEADKQSISVEMRDIVIALRQLQSHTSKPFIGSVSSGAVQDRFFRTDYEIGPLESIKSYNDLLYLAAVRMPLEMDTSEGLYRDYLSDLGEIYFTHGDLTLANIIISDSNHGKKIAGIIDWEQSGWYPEYWEYCKLLYAVDYEHEWRAGGWADKVMQAYENEWFAFAEYSLWRCP